MHRRPRAAEPATFPETPRFAACHIHVAAMRCDFGHAGDVDMQDEKTLDIEDMGAVTLALPGPHSPVCRRACAGRCRRAHPPPHHGKPGDSGGRGVPRSDGGAGHWRLIPRSVGAALIPYLATTSHRGADAGSARHPSKRKPSVACTRRSHTIIHEGSAPDTAPGNRAAALS